VAAAQPVYYGDAARMAEELPSENNIVRGIRNIPVAVSSKEVVLYTLSELLLCPPISGKFLWVGKKRKSTLNQPILFTAYPSQQRPSLDTLDLSSEWGNKQTK
jgi:hypothetical protein